MKLILPLLTIASLSVASLLSCAPTAVGPPVAHPSTVGIKVLPAGYRKIYVAGVPYYFNGSRWYRRSHGRYIICSRPRGYVPRRVIAPTRVIRKSKKHVIIPNRKIIRP